MRERWMRVAILVLGCFLLAGGLAGCFLKPPVRAGSRAPDFAVTEWMQGEPVTSLADGHITVVELWATWCGPCLGAIPQLDELQRRYAAHGVQVVAVAVWDGRDRVRDFVTQRGKELSYAIAFDGEGSIWDTWRPGWFERYVPCTFVVDGEGRVVERSHPAFADDLLARMVTGAWPSAALDLLRAEIEALTAAAKREEWTVVERIADRALALDPRDAIAWTWKARAHPDAAERDAVVRQGIAATRAVPLQLGLFVRRMAELGFLVACAEDAHRALAAVAESPPGLAFPCARMLAAAAVGDEALLATAEDIRMRLAGAPHELVAITRALNGEHATPVLRGALLGLLETAAAAGSFAELDSQRLFLLLAVDAAQEHIDAVGRDLVEHMAGRVSDLNSLAWQLLEEPATLPKARAVALRAAQAMAAVPGWDTPGNLDTLALAQFENGDVDAAIATQEQAIAKNGDHPSKAYAERLTLYRAAKAGPPAGVR